MPPPEETTTTIQTSVESLDTEFGQMANGTSHNLETEKSGEKCLDCLCNCTLSNSQTDTEMTTQREPPIHASGWSSFSNILSFQYSNADLFCMSFLQTTQWVFLDLVLVD